VREDRRLNFYDECESKSTRTDHEVTNALDQL